MSIDRHARSGFALLELLLVLALVALILQLFPSFWAALDARTWSRATWVVLNLVVLASLVIGRHAEPIIGSMHDFARYRAANKAKVRQEKSRREKNAELEEQRKLYERMREARKRQIV